MKLLIYRCASHRAMDDDLGIEVYTDTQPSPASRPTARTASAPSSPRTVSSPPFVALRCRTALLGSGASVYSVEPSEAERYG
jgi:hypothetical protein